MYKNSKKSWSFALQAVYMTFKFALLTTEHKAYAVFDTTEFKDTLVHRGCEIILCYFFRRIFGFTDKTDPVLFDNTVS